MVATAALVAIVFVTIYFVTRHSIYSHLDSDLTYEAHKHAGEIEVKGQHIVFNSKAEWEEREHREAEVNPVFIQIVGLGGELMDKSPNLKEDHLKLRSDIPEATKFNTLLREKNIRQLQVPVVFNEERVGFILAALSIEDSLQILTRLRNILWVSFPIILSILFVVTRILAGQSIRPVIEITHSADKITRHTLDERMQLPENQDEIYSLSESINRLLDRLSEAMAREKQFTADASHELRTPLTVLKGTLEVLLRKPRSVDKYKIAINEAIQEINRMTRIVDQLLILARVGGGGDQQNQQTINLLMAVDEVIHRNAAIAGKKKLHINVQPVEGTYVKVDLYLLDLILQNLISNAIKYSNDGGRISISFAHKDGQLECAIIDTGIGIKKDDLPHVFIPFFRSEALDHRSISGDGLGLAIVQKACSVLAVTIELNSAPGIGTTVSLRFPSKNEATLHPRIFK